MENTQSTNPTISNKCRTSCACGARCAWLITLRRKDCGLCPAPVDQSSPEALLCPWLVSLPTCGSLCASHKCPLGTCFPPVPGRRQCLLHLHILKKYPPPEKIGRGFFFMQFTLPRPPACGSPRPALHGRRRYKRRRWDPPGGRWSSAVPVPGR